MTGMPTRSDVMETLKGVIDPELGSDLVDLGMIQDVQVTDDGVVTIDLALTIAECPMRNQIESDTTRKVGSLPGVTRVEIRTTAMTKQQRADLMSTARFRVRERAEPTKLSPTTRVIAISSGKGGVGKSSASTNLALATAAMGYRVGLLDADIWGFSIPRMLNITERIMANEERNLVPVEAYGLKVVSTGLIVESEETALMWRGLMLSKALEQFLKQVEWGELDYLFLDMPPGTGDVQMALTRLLPQAEMIVVTTPQQAAQKVAIRVADMARRSFMPVVGALENMSHFVCDHGEVYELFGSGGGAELAEALNVPLIGSIPIDPQMVAGGDNGLPVVVHAPDSPSGRAFREAAERLIQIVPPAQDETCTGRIAKLLEALPVTSHSG